MLSEHVTADSEKDSDMYVFIFSNSLFHVPQVAQIYPQQGWNEIDPEDVWTKFQNVFKMALESTSLSQNFYFV